ncbi:MAG: polyprenyl synthetase family protein [Pseudomonadota bacterium]
MDFTTHLGATAAELETTLEALIRQPAAATMGEPRLWDAMRYATLGGGKRLRGFLAAEGATIMGVSRQAGLRAGAAAECLHAYSLVHDDLPAMDDDDLRRGKPTTHKAFDEAIAILAGDALQTLAFEICADPATHSSGSVRANLCHALAVAAGGPGMVGGQMIDIAAETADQALTIEQITRLQAMKTGALIKFAAEAGAILADDKAAQDALGTYATHLGLAFQIRDDLLDVEGDEASAGKRLQKDANAGKATFVSLLGVSGARKAASEEVDAAIAAIRDFGSQGKWLQEAAEFAIHRKN